MNVVSVVGARPQFIKAAPVSKALRAGGHTEFLVHTGQHYDGQMSQVFFDEMRLPSPDVNLGVGSGSHGRQTGTMLMALEPVLMDRRPDWVIVYGDTNSTLAGALAAGKLNLPLAHVEAGLRSFNRVMPEEINRVLADHCADLLCCPTMTAVENLAREGIVKGVTMVGDTMFDAVLAFKDVAERHSDVLDRLGLSPGGYLLATLHRPYNVDVGNSLTAILEAFDQVGEVVVFPVHPRTRQRIRGLGRASQTSGSARVRLIDPVGYLDMLQLERHARLVLTDSGGVQKEAFFFHVPCLTLRPETEWVETVSSGWNRLVPADKEAIVAAVKSAVRPVGEPPPVFGDGHAALRIVAAFGG